MVGVGKNQGKECDIVRQVVVEILHETCKFIATSHP